MQPQIAIAYNSQVGFGALGTGCDIAGVSSISRVPKNIYYDGINDVIHLDDNDAIALDGQRLILLPNTASNLQDGAIYGTEIENFTRVKVTTNPAGGIYFTVTTKDGKTMEYGKTVDSQVKNASKIITRVDSRVLAWKMDKATDTYGNFMCNTYTEYGQCLQKIEYAGQSVVFNYTTNTVNPKNSYVTDFLISKTKILSSISTLSGTTKIKDYIFTYLSDNRLSSIGENAPDQTILNSTKINWGDESRIQETVVCPVYDRGMNNQSSSTGSLNFADVNGDGHPDRIEFWTGGTIRVYLYDKSTFNFSTTPSALATFASNDAELYKQKITTGDINNDGKDEIIFADRDWLRVYSYDNTDQLHLNQNISIPPPAGGYNTQRTYDLLVSNVNKDEYNDVVIVYNYHENGWGTPNNVPGYHILRGTSNGLESLGLVTVGTEAMKNFVLGDFNADGKLEILGLSDLYSDAYDFTNNEKNLSFIVSGAWGNLTKNAIQKIPGDFNGDGLTDVLSQNNDTKEWSLNFRKDGAATPIAVKMPIINVSDVYPENHEIHQVYNIDYNGDGLPDIIVGDEILNHLEYINTTWYFYKNTGGNFIEEVDRRQVWTTTSIRQLQGAITDINGDGVADLVVPKGDNFVAFTMFNANRMNLVTSITNGMNQTNSFAYENFSNYDQTVETGVVRNLKAPLLLVDTHTQADGSINTFGSILRNGW